MRDLTARRLVSCMAWPGGSYALDADAPIPTNARPLRSDPIPLVHVGVEAHWSAERILEDLCSKLSFFPRPRPELGGALARLQKDPEIDRVLAALAGSGTLEAVAGVAIRSPRALAALWTLDAAGWLEYDETPPAKQNDADDAALTAEPEIVIVTQAVPEAPGPRDRSGDPGAKSTDTSAEADKLSREISETHATLGELDHYAALGVDAEAPAAKVRKAYFLAAKRYHPDGLRRLGLDDETQRMAGEIFARIAEANEVLSDPERREAYDAEQAGGITEEEAARAGEAEAHFRKGSVLIKMGDFRAAAPFLEKAVGLWPDEAAYQAALGWSLFRKNPPGARARPHPPRACAGARPHQRRDPGVAGPGRTRLSSASRRKASEGSARG